MATSNKEIFVSCFTIKLVCSFKHATSDGQFVSIHNFSLLTVTVSTFRLYSTERDVHCGIMTGKGCGRKRPWPERGIIALYDWRASRKSAKIINNGHYGKPVF
jgi:hypothetical protein